MSVVVFAPQPKVIVDFTDGTLAGPMRLLTAFGFPLLETESGIDHPEQGAEMVQRLVAKARSYGVRPGDWVTVRVANRGQCTWRFGQLQTTKQVEIEKAA